MAFIRGWVGGREGAGWVGKLKAGLPIIRPQTVSLCSQQTTGMYTNHKIDWDGHWQQFGTQPILISAPQWADRPCNALTQFYRVSKKPSVKAGLAIYSHAVDVSGQCISESLTLGQNLDFSFSDIMVSFCKSSHIIIIFLLMKTYACYIATHVTRISVYSLHLAMNEWMNTPG